MNGQVEVTLKTLRTIAHSCMVHMRVSEAYINFALIHTSDLIFLLIPIKDLINEDGESTTPFKLETGKKNLVSYLRVLPFPGVVRKANSHVRTKALNMCHQAQKRFCGIFVLIPHHQKGYVVYVTHRQKIISSYDVVFDDIFSSALAYRSQPYAEAMDMQSAV